jgi:predicted nicotinamide N-methyase
MFQVIIKDNKSNALSLLGDVCFSENEAESIIDNQKEIDDTKDYAICLV